MTSPSDPMTQSLSPQKGTPKEVTLSSGVVFRLSQSGDPVYPYEWRADANDPHGWLETHLAGSLEHCRTFEDAALINSLSSSGETPKTVAWIERFTSAVCESVAELPDRDSPEDWPEAMLVTADELTSIIENRFADLSVSQEETRPNVSALMSRLEDAMDRCMDQPLNGDRMSLTRSWRNIIEEWQSPVPFSVSPEVEPHVVYLEGLKDGREDAESRATRQAVTDEMVERACETFYPNWHRYTPGYRQAKSTRWAKALHAVIGGAR